MTFLSLFAGIGGIEKGFEAAGLTCIAQVERDPFCLAVLEKHWPSVPKFTNIEDFSVDTKTNTFYGSRYATKRLHKTRVEEGLHGSNQTVSVGTVTCGNCGTTWDYPTSHARHPPSAQCADEIQASLRIGEPLLSRRKTRKRQVAKQNRESNLAGACPACGQMRSVRCIPEIQGREKRDTGTPSRLQQTTGSDVALPEMPSRMAQKQQGNRKEGLNAESKDFDGTIDVVVGGFP